ncbi:MAG: hypothetical protein NTX50_18060 [Candidatus Sumerlaeota bacterium]|nr:hypothetical protein [Candidatus Sumerlaeota bacterium]
MNRGNHAIAVSLILAGAVIAGGCVGGKSATAPSENIEIIIDNSAVMGFDKTGEWTSVGESDDRHFGPDLLWAYAKSAEHGAATATWTPDLPKAGQYEVSIWYGNDPNQDHDTKAPFVVRAAGKEYPFTVNLRENCGQWNKLGVFKMAKGTGNSVKTYTTENGNAIADAVKFVYVGK